MVNLKYSDKRKQGNQGVAAAIKWFMNHDYVVALPISESQRYDLIIDKNHKLSRVQVKTSRNKDKYNKYEVLIKTCGGNRSWSGVTKHFSKEESDLLFILLENGKMFLIPSAIITATCSLTPEEKYKEYEVMDD